MKIRRYIIMGSIIITILCFVSLSIYAYPVDDFVDIDYQQQTYSNICWAACGSVILNYYGHSISQFTFDVVVKNGFENEAATLSEVKEGLAYFDVGCTLIYSYLSHSSICTQIYGNRPIFAGWSWNYYPYGGHAIVIDGYDTSFGNYVNYMDPADGEGYYELYSWFKGGIGYDHTWFGTLYNMHND